MRDDVVRQAGKDPAVQYVAVFCSLGDGLTAPKLNVEWGRIVDALVPGT